MAAWNVQLTDPVFADIISGRRGWPTEEELQAMSEKPQAPRVISTPVPARETPQTTRETDEMGVLGGLAHTSNAPADGSMTLDDGRVIATNSAQPANAVIEMYTPAADVTETDANGSVIQIASKGVPMPMAEAKRLGLVKDRLARASQETKG